LSMKIYAQGRIMWKLQQEISGISEMARHPFVMTVRTRNAMHLNVLACTYTSTDKEDRTLRVFYCNSCYNTNSSDQHMVLSYIMEKK
jgi:hypothetical protein